MIAEGAYRKATLSLMEPGEVVSGSDCRTWAELLRPPTGDISQALTRTTSPNTGATATPHPATEQADDPMNSNAAAAPGAGLEAGPEEDTAPSGRGDGPSTASQEENQATTTKPDDPLKGVRFGALKAPSASGARPEHIGEILGVRRRAANKAREALGRLIHMTIEGKLAEEARWTTFSRTVFIGTKGGKKPRPLKMAK